MRASRGWSAAAWTALGGCGLPACIDLFHSTSDVRTACEIDASACEGDASAASAAGATSSLCQTPDTARQIAAHACAWLGACASPMGQNAFGPCMVQALLAFDCAANPDHPAVGTTGNLWACLAEAGSCPQVQQCILPGEPPQCSSVDSTECGGHASDGGTGNSRVRLECGSPDQGLVGEENCGLWETTCLSDGGSASCGENAPGYACGGDAGVFEICTPQSAAVWCGPTGETGIDCTGNGAGLCGVFPASTSPDETPWVSCVPEIGANQAETCAPSLAFMCDAGVALSCATGAPETIDCAALLGDPNACGAGAAVLQPPFDWTSPCAVDPPECDADTCDGSIVTGCARGASFSVDCEAESLGDCRIVLTDLETRQHAACSLPP